MLPIGNINANDANVVVNATKKTFLWILKAGHAGNDFAHRLPAEQRDAIVCFLAGIDRLIARSRNLAYGEMLILQLGLLEAHYVRLIQCQPFQNLREANFKRIYVPGGYLHVLWSEAAGLKYIHYSKY